MASSYSTGRRGLQYGAGSQGAEGVQVTGGSDFYALARHLKNAGEAELRKEFLASARIAAKPLVPKVRDAARSNLPKRGGLNERIARKKYAVSTRTGAKTAGVRITGSKVDPRINDQGRVYHPVFGRPHSGVVQQVPAAQGYFDRTLEREGADVQAAILDAMQEWTIRLLKDGI